VKAKFKVIDGRMAALASPSRELGIEALAKMPIVKRFGGTPLRGTNHPDQLVPTSFDLLKTFTWNFRNELGECVSAGVYLAIGWIDNPNLGIISTGWHKFVVY
jgi:hypothetical protein